MGDDGLHIPVLAFDEITLSTAPGYLIKGLFPRSGIAVVWGPPKCGKSFWVFDALMHVALGWQYRGRKVRAGPVLYCAFEGGGRFDARIEAFRQHHTLDTDAVPFFFVPKRLDLVRHHRALIKAVREVCTMPTVVVLDTLNRSMSGSESKDEDMGDYLAAADVIREAFGCLVVIIHHCGINGDRPRGHTSLTAAADVQISVRKDAAGNVVASVEYMKDGPDGETVVSQLERIVVGIDDDGDEIDTCIVLPADQSRQQKPAAKLSATARAGLNQLYECLADEGEKLSPSQTSNLIPASVTCVTLNAWRERLAKTGVINADASYREQFRRIRVTLSNAGFIGIWDDFVWASHSVTWASHRRHCDGGEGVTSQSPPLKRGDGVTVT